MGAGDYMNRMKIQDDEMLKQLHLPKVLDPTDEETDDIIDHT